MKIAIVENIVTCRLITKLALSLPIILLSGVTEQVAEFTTVVADFSNPSIYSDPLVALS